MNSFLPGMENEKRRPELSQWFTDPKTASRIAQFAMAKYFGHGRSPRVLEPSCGQGSLLKALSPFGLASVTAVDLDSEAIATCESKRWPWPTRFIGANFLSWYPSERFDLAVMNPPFENGQTERHIMHALRYCDTVVCHCPLTTLAAQDRLEKLWSKVELTRIAICSSRPKYGPGGGMTEMCTVEVASAGRPVTPLRTGPVIHEPRMEFWP